MNEPVLQAVVTGCPHCPTRRECACPDGPEKCPDNPNCPCDPEVCPCKRRRRLPEPPGCLTRPLLLGFGGAALAGLLALVGVLVFGEDDEASREAPIGVSPSGATITTLAAGAAPTYPATTQSAPVPTPSAPPLGPDVGDDADAIFGGKGLFVPEYCTPVPPGWSQLDQTGGSPLADPSLDIEAFCMRRAMLDGSQVPMLSGDYLIVAVVHKAPLDPGTNIGYQPGIGFDLPSLANNTPKSAGEGLLQVPLDTVGFGGSLTGWAEADFYSVPGFGPSGLHGYAFSQAGSRVTGFAVPSEMVPFDSRVFLQSFGRMTAPGAIPTNADPSSSTLVSAGAAPCLGDCMVSEGRFQVGAAWPDDLGVVVNGAEGANGTFWFFDEDNAKLMVKVLNSCGTTGSERYWVFAGGLTDVQVTITVTDTSSGDVRTYDDTLGKSFAPILDTDAFATCP